MEAIIQTESERRRRRIRMLMVDLEDRVGGYQGLARALGIHPCTLSQAVRGLRTTAGYQDKLARAEDYLERMLETGDGGMDDRDREADLSVL